MLPEPCPICDSDRVKELGGANFRCLDCGEVFQPEPRPTRFRKAGTPKGRPALHD